MMIFSITTSRSTQDQAPKVEEFLKSFLPKMRKFPGVITIYHYARPDKYDDSTIVIWESQAAIQPYRESELVQKAMAYEKTNNLPATREANPLFLSL